MPSSLIASNRSRKFNRKVVIIPLALLAVFSTAIILHVNGGDGSPDKQVLAANTNSETKKHKTTDTPKPKKVTDTSALKADLTKIIKKYPYDSSVSVVDLNSGTLVQAGDSYPFVAASTTKLLTALLYFNNVEAGQLGLNDDISGKPAKEQLELMINKSDNNAWASLNNELSKQSLEAYAHKNGFQSYNAEKNTINSNDMAQLLAKLYNKQLINSDHTSLLLSWMQNTSEETFIPPAVPKENKLYHKAGYLNDRIHDAAIIDNGSAPFVLVIYSKSYSATYDASIGKKLFNQVTSNVINTFNK